MRARVIATLAAIMFLTAGCVDGGGEESPSPAPSPSPPPTETTTPTAPAGLEQPAIWPAADVVFDTPEAAADDFIIAGLGVTARLGAFLPGDARSGEIVVSDPGEVPTTRSVLLLRQLGPDDGWFVIGAINENESITSPESGADVPAEPLTVEAVGRGFEGVVVVEAFPAGDAERIDRKNGQGGSMETPEPFSVELDLSSAAPGDVVTILVQGSVGNENFPGDFSAIPVVVG